MRTIDADELKEEMRSWLALPNRDKDSRDVVLHLIAVIDNAPTVEPKPEIPPELLNQVVEIIRDILPQLVEIAKDEVKNGIKTTGQAIREKERDCENCEHHKPKGNGFFGCELWECKFKGGAK